MIIWLQGKWGCNRNMISTSETILSPKTNFQALPIIKCKFQIFEYSEQRFQKSNIFFIIQIISPWLVDIDINTSTSGLFDILFCKVWTKILWDFDLFVLFHHIMSVKYSFLCHDIIILYFEVKFWEKNKWDSGNFCLHNHLAPFSYLWNMQSWRCCWQLRLDGGWVPCSTAQAEQTGKCWNSTSPASVWLLRLKHCTCCQPLTLRHLWSSWTFMVWN